MAGDGRWPNGAKAAIAFTIDNMAEAADLNRGLWPADQPVGSHYSVTEVLPKFLAMLKKYDVHATYFIESWNLSHYPTAVRQVAEAGHEIAWHAWQHEAWNQLDQAAEKANFERSFGAEGLRGFTAAGGEGEGVVDRYRGFRPPGGIIHGDRTLNLCKNYGLDYISPAAEDAALVSLQGGKDHIVVLPFRWSTVDAYYYMDAFSGLRKMKGQLPAEPQSSKTLVERYKAEIDNAIETGGYVSTLFHPFLTNTAERLEAMDTVTQYMVRKRDEGVIWLARCCDVANFISKHPDTVGGDPKWDTSSWR
ncbi:hypothetical protein BAUCODRAFT_465430 [Baudoinia panamericana UAMH 10762]|uniref:chitin deacetylase n=1 Tax=Baudoinia panamericana (strain UAMH 10762) TaxID=717646 RepID=M2NAL0_BAUPA|nr:uncharacterized protein BAUCODRAFT_465430 [Baudoinia panamericana UAMH 10762]EMC96174.1 hypothetical protein BAUCODRAFT_465430 [Baudoinia panamericana UAMH 10762]